eukprot:2784044-Heterocapsa_arctica.AAC.1
MARQCGGYHWCSGTTPSSRPWRSTTCCPHYSLAIGWAAGTDTPGRPSAKEPWRTRPSSAT